MLCHFSLYGFWWKSAVSQIVFSFVNKMLFSLFFVSSVFRNVSMMYLGKDFFVFPFLKVSQLLWLCRFKSFAKLEKFSQPLFLNILCQPLPPSPLLSGALMTSMLDLSYSSTGLWGCPFVWCVDRVGHEIATSSRFCFGYCTFHFEIFHLVLVYIFYFFYQIFCFFFHFLRVFRIPPLKDIFFLWLL